MTTHSTAIDTGKTRPLVRIGGLPRVEGHGPLGIVSELMRDQFGALRRWQRDYGGVFELRVGPATFVVAADANAAAEMLIEGGNTFVRGGAMYAPMNAVFGDSSMVTTEGEVWRARRRGAQPQFRQRAIVAMGERVDRTLDEILAELGPGEVDMYRFSGRVSMSVGLAVMFGHGLNHPGFAELGSAIDYAIGQIGVGWVADQLPRWLPIPGRRRFRRELAVIDAKIYALIESRRASGELGDDMLGMLLHMSDDGATSDGVMSTVAMSTVDVRNEAVALIIAGYETTANALGWALLELARSPELLAAVRAEADDELTHGVPPSPKSLAHTRRIFMESLRMYPSVLWVPRNAAENTTLGGYPIAAGTAVVCSPYLVHHDPHAWDEPERFDPERFAEGSNQPLNRHAFVPFGLGQHMCIGQHLAMLEGPLALARIVQRWDLATIPHRQPVQKISTTMKAKRGIWLKLSPRTA
jgi:cytochrome P450